MRNLIFIYPIFIIGFLFSILKTETAFAQNKAKHYFKMDYVKDMVFIGDKTVKEPFYISTKPITNRDYILFLIWITKTYVDYTDYYVDALPGLSDSIKRCFNDRLYLLFEYEYAFDIYLQKAEPYVADYIFNTEYLDYPIIGITWEQANMFTRWLSDRYNENSLFTNKVLEFEDYYKNEDSFSTESYLFDNYVGRLNVNCSDYDYLNLYERIKKLKKIIRPTFHIATSYELEALNRYFDNKKMDVDFGRMKNYKECSFEFLDIYYNHYLTYDNKQNLILNKYFVSEEGGYNLTNNKTTKFVYPEKYSEWCLDSYLTKQADNLASIYNGYGFIDHSFKKLVQQREDDVIQRKDSIGIFPYIVIGDKEDELFNVLKTSVFNPKSANIVKPFIYDHNKNMIINKDGDIFTTFRVAVNAIKKQ